VSVVTGAKNSSGGMLIQDKYSWRKVVCMQDMFFKINANPKILNHILISKKQI
jgi:hypothetical protein